MLKLSSAPVLDTVSITVPAPRSLVPGERLQVVEWFGKEHLESAPQILLLHGSGQSTELYSGLAHSLASEFKVFAMNLRGHGWASYPEQDRYDYSCRAKASDIKVVLNYLKVERPVLIGYSVGGLSALTFAAQYPELVRGLILIDIAPTVDIKNATRIKEKMQSPPKVLHDGHEHEYLFDPQYIHHVSFSDFERTWDCVGALRCPTALVYGVNNTIVPKTSIEKLSAAIQKTGVPYTYHELPGDHHQIFNHLSKVSTITVEFVRSITESSTSLLSRSG